MNSFKKIGGFTLQEMMLAVAVLAILGVASVPGIQREIQEDMDQQGVVVIENVIGSFKQFRAVNRRNPTTMTELVNSPFYQGNGLTPWSSTIAGAPSASGRAYSFTIPARNSAQAERLAGKLAKFSPSVSGSLITLNSPISTIEVAEDQMLCRRDIGVSDCNVMEVNLDAGNQDILGAGEVEGTLGHLTTVISDRAQIDTLVTENEILLGVNSISHDGNTLKFNAALTSFSGGMSLGGNLIGNNSNISGVNRLEANSLISNSVDAKIGDIKDLSGITLDFDSGIFKEVTVEETISDFGDFGTVTSKLVNSVSVTTKRFEGDNGVFNNLDADKASGSELTLSGLLDVNSFKADISNIGTGVGNSLNLSGNASGSSSFFNFGNFGSLIVSGAITGGDFEGNDFTTSLSSVNKNKSFIDNNAKAIANNDNDNNTNRNNINELETDISAYAQTITTNSSKIVSNRQLAQSNAKKIGENTGAITSLKTKSAQIESSIASLKSQLELCESKGGCSW